MSEGKERDGDGVRESRRSNRSRTWLDSQSSRDITSHMATMFFSSMQAVLKFPVRTGDEPRVNWLLLNFCINR